jgi:hypothetical protein
MRRVAIARTGVWGIVVLFEPQRLALERAVDRAQPVELGVLLPPRAGRGGGEVRRAGGAAARAAEAAAEEVEHLADDEAPP